MIHRADRNQADLALILSAALEAGQLALSYFGKNPRNWQKQGDSPVSEADLAVDELLKNRLQAARPHYGWLSEETADTRERLSLQHLFIVDPIDGTRGFLAGTPEWVISIGVVEAGVAVAGVLVQPVTGDVFSASLSGGAWRNQQPIQVGTRTRPEHACAAGLGVILPVILPPFAQTLPRIASLALRLARVASGDIDIGFARAGAHDWDLAAADIILREAGALLTDFDGIPPVYNQAHTHHSALIAANAALHAAVLQREA